jgi:hypothetical protein
MEMEENVECLLDSGGPGHVVVLKAVPYNISMFLYMEQSASGV